MLYNWKERTFFRMKGCLLASDHYQLVKSMGKAVGCKRENSKKCAIEQNSIHFQTEKKEMQDRYEENINKRCITLKGHWCAKTLG